MPSGPLGPCWANGSWWDTSWEVNSWCPAVTVPVVVRGHDAGRRAAQQLPRLIQRRRGASLAAVEIAAVGAGVALRTADAIAAVPVSAVGLGRKVAQAGAVAVGLELTTFHATRVRRHFVATAPVAAPLQFNARRAWYLGVTARQAMPAVSREESARDEGEELALLEVA